MLGTWRDKLIVTIVACVVLACAGCGSEPPPAPWPFIELKGEVRCWIHNEPGAEKGSVSSSGRMRYRAVGPTHDLRVRDSEVLVAPDRSIVVGWRGGGMPFKQWIAIGMGGVQSTPSVHPGPKFRVVWAYEIWHGEPGAGELLVKDAVASENWVVKDEDGNYKLVPADEPFSPREVDWPEVFDDVPASSGSEAIPEGEAPPEPNGGGGVPTCKEAIEPETSREDEIKWPTP